MAGSSSINRCVSMNAAMSMAVSGGIWSLIAPRSLRAPTIAFLKRLTSLSIADFSSVYSGTSINPRVTTCALPMAMPLEAPMP